MSQTTCQYKYNIKQALIHTHFHSERSNTRTYTRCNMLRSITLFTLLCALSAQAVPAPMPQDPTETTATQDLSKHNTCSEDGKGVYIGDQLQPCDEGTICRGIGPCAWAEYVCQATSK